MKNISIIGAGFTGLAAAYHLSKKGHTITLYDPKGLGGGASGVSAGLLHPFTGPQAKLAWRGLEGMAAAKQLLQAAEAALGYPVARAEGIRRVAISEDQKESFRRAAEYPGVEETADGIFIRDGLAVDVRAYLYGLFLACESQGVRLIQKPGALNGPTVIAAGMESLKLVPDLPLTPVKGQILKLKWPDIPPLPCPLNAHGYIVMERDNKSCWAGATFERRFADPGVDLEEAKRQILPKVREVIPELADAPILDCQAGIRASTPDKRPILKQIGDEQWVLTGMGSKGLLYHALFAEELSQNF